MPDHYVRLETGSKKLSVIIFKSILSYIKKILSMEDGRFPKICFNRLKKLAMENPNNNIIYN